MRDVPLLALDPDVEQTLIRGTRAAQDDPLVKAVVDAFVQNPTPALLRDLTRLLSVTNPAHINRILVQLPIPVDATRQALHDAVLALYAGLGSDVQAISTARGAILEAITLEFVCRRFSGPDGECYSNRKVAVSGKTLHELVKETSPANIDVVAWKTNANEAEFYECKLGIFDIVAGHLVSLQWVHQVCSRAPEPRRIIAAICTLTDPVTIRGNLLAPSRDGGMRELHLQYPDVEFLNLAEVIPIQG